MPIEEEKKQPDRRRTRRGDASFDSEFASSDSKSREEPVSRARSSPKMSQISKQKPRRKKTLIMARRIKSQRARKEIDALPMIKLKKVKSVSPSPTKKPIKNVFERLTTKRIPSCQVCFGLMNHEERCKHRSASPAKKGLDRFNTIKYDKIFEEIKENKTDLQRKETMIKRNETLRM